MHSLTVGCCFTGKRNVEGRNAEVKGARGDRRAAHVEGATRPESLGRELYKWRGYNTKGTPQHPDFRVK